MSKQSEEFKRLRAYEQETIAALRDAGLVGPPGVCIAELLRDCQGHRQASLDRDAARFEVAALKRQIAEREPKGNGYSTCFTCGEPIASGPDGSACFNGHPA